MDRLRAPLIAAAGVLLTVLSVAGAFGVARLIFQDGYLSGILNFQSQGFVDAWAPLFFGAMVFGVAMDYTLFMLSAAKEGTRPTPIPSTPWSALCAPLAGLSSRPPP